MNSFAPVITDVAYRIVLVLMLINNYIGEIVDVETAFLYGELEEEIYMEIPDGLGIYLNKKFGRDDCLVLNRAIYGLVQAARQFYKKLITVLVGKMKFVKCFADQCLLRRSTAKGIAIICIYVDDTLYVGNKEAITEFKKEIENYFNTKEEGIVNEYVGCKLLINNNT